MHNLCTIGQS